MSHHTHDTPDAEGHDHPHSQGEGEGFFDKVKEFFTGPADDRTSEDDGRGWAGDSETAADAPITDSVADSTESVDSTDSGWDGSDEPPELAVPGNEAVAASSDTSADDSFEAGMSDDGLGVEGLGDTDYESRHGNGVDDSGVLADAPVEDSSEWTEGERASDVAESDDSQHGDSQDDSGAETGEEDRARREEEFAREHDPATHDVAAGEEFRQPGDWTAEEHGGPQVQEPDGTVHNPGESASDEAWGDSAGESSESGLDDVRDGGHGWGSAAPIEGGAMPLGHPVKAWHDTMTFVMPGEDGYEGSEAHEWFVDGQAAQNAGFRHAHGG